MNVRSLLLLTLLPCATAFAQSPSPQVAAAESAREAAPAVHHAMVKLAGLKWGDAPPFFERGSQFAVLSGDPSAQGLFVVRLKLPDGYRIARHHHPSDEHVTVLQGELSLDMGRGAAAHRNTFATGDYVLLPAKMEHAAAAKGETILQVHGTGPFAIEYVDPKDDPRQRGGNRGGQ